MTKNNNKGHRVGLHSHPVTSVNIFVIMHATRTTEVQGVKYSHPSNQECRIQSLTTHEPMSLTTMVSRELPKLMPGILLPLFLSTCIQCEEANTS